MKILLLLGSPHAKGTSATLAESFCKGATEKDHEVVKIDCSKLNVHPCIACGNCLKHGVCVWTDDMPAVEKAVRDCDAIIFVTPVYYAGITAQLKVVIDRFYSFNGVLLKNKPKLGLITAAHESELSSTNAVILNFEEIVKYLGSENIGMVNALGCGGPEDLEGKPYLQQAYEMGISI